MENKQKSSNEAHSEPLQQYNVVGSADLNLELTSENVHELFMELKNNSEKIESLLKQLPDSFQQGKGDGMSFLNMCETKTGNQWCFCCRTFYIFND